MLTQQQRAGFQAEIWIGVTQAARMLKVSPGTVYKLIEEGLLDSYQRHGEKSHWQIKKASVERLIEQWVLEAGAVQGGLARQR